MNFGCFHTCEISRWGILSTTSCTLDVLHSTLTLIDGMDILVGTASLELHQFRVDKDTFALTSTTQTPQPGFLCLDDDTVYAVSEAEEGKAAISRFVRNGSTWDRVWRSKSTSDGTCHCAIAQTNGKKFVLTANYTGHTVDVHDTEGNLTDTISYNGSGPFEERQESSHCHQFVQDLRAEYLYVNDLGDDKLYRYKLSSEGKLKSCGSITLDPASGPRHCSFNTKHPDLVYLMCELSNEIVVFKWAADDSATAKELQRISILPNPETQKTGKHDAYPQPSSGGEIQITKDGTFIHATTRYLPTEYATDTILSAKLKASDGLIEESTISHFETGLVAPWHFSLSNDQHEQFLCVAFKDSARVVLYRRDIETGKVVEEVARTEKGQVKDPSCVLFLS